MPSDVTIPQDLLPNDGRFGSGPSKVRPEAVAALSAAAPGFLGTSHRKPSVKSVVGALREGVSSMLNLPDGYEVILGNGGTTVFWDAATFGLIEEKSQHLSFGEFSSKFAKAAAAAPHIGEPEVIESGTGSHPTARADASVDLYALTHNETSTGVAMPIARPEGSDGLVAVDATSGAGGLRFDASETDVYYFAPQKCLAADGGLWLAACSPAALERIDRISKSGRWIPTSIDLATAVDNSLKDQTYNTPALATLHLTLSQVSWINENGGIEFSAGRCDASAHTIYSWADAHALAEPFVTDTAMRSHTVATIDFDESIDADDLAAILRANGILDTESYRKLGRNQLRIALFPAIEPADIAALTACIDHVIGQIAA